MKQLTIQMVTWNSARHLVWSLPALAQIPADAAEIRIIDNASTDDSLALIRKILPHAEVIQLPTNQGFAGAHNIGFARCRTPLVLTLDHDVQLEWSGIEKVLACFSNEKVGAAQGKLLRRDQVPGGHAVIDSAGIMLTRALNGRERGANEADLGQFDEPAGLMAVTGACGLYRVSALRAVAHNLTEFFDADFFAYKEDVDLGWRLRKAGYHIQYQPLVVGFHARTLGRRGWFNWGVNPVKILKRLRSRRTYYSLRNWLWMITKNSTLPEELKHEFYIDIRLLVFLLMSLVYWPLFPVWGEITRGLPKMRQKRDRQASVAGRAETIHSEKP